tara:strand:- start:223 stop:651 length:429 start_codon:yes stop_codon:yes gene_type:complete
MTTTRKWIPYVEIYPRTKATKKQGMFGPSKTVTTTAKEPRFRYEALDNADARRIKGLIERTHKQKAVITKQLSPEHTFSMTMRLTGRTDIDPSVNDKELRANMREALPGTELTYAARIKSLKLTGDQAQIIKEAMEKPRDEE